MKNILFYSLSLFLLFISCKNDQYENGDHSDQKLTNQQDQLEDWEILSNGQDLSNWKILGSDKVSFFVEEGVIVGEAQKGIPNSFLATKKEYEDFILEIEFNVDPELNSGVQIRSGIYQKVTTTNYISGNLEKSERTWNKGRVFGSQIEIDPSSRAWTGGFYEEGGRGWLQPLTDNEAARNAYKKEGWNKFKVIADDNHFQSWINGVKAADIYDDVKRSGFIALQLHSANRDEQIEKKIRFRNIRIKELP